MSQANRLYNLLYDGQPHRTDEIMRVVYGADHLGIARIAARVNDLKKQGLNIKPAWPDPEKPTLSWYQLIKTDCCESFGIFKIHAQNCLRQKHGQIKFSHSVIG